MTRQPRGPRPKHVPQRTCIACREVGGKRGLVRLVRTGGEEGGEGTAGGAPTVVVDPSGKQAGRGAYLHPTRTCWEIGLKGSRIEQALRIKLTPANRQALQEYARSLPDADPPGDDAGAEPQPGAAQAARTE
jgi:predicted RNA-binding protein YlxR (DUF448 family)